jgi:uncharacterized protein (TIGR00255 family)
MIRSMTGFGRAEVESRALVIAIEVRSVNHRHLDIALRLPRSLAGFEMEARRLVQSRLERGRVEIAVQATPATGQASQQIRVDQALARTYAAEARLLGDTLGVAGDVSLTWLLERPGVVKVEEAAVPDEASLWRLLAEALSLALEELVARRSAEGAMLAGELRGLHASLGATVEQIAVRLPAAAARRLERFQERFRALLGEVAVDESRILTEMAVWAERTDITEELARLRAHLEQFALVLEKGGAVGRLFDFLLQELNREVNTVASKADDLDLSQAAIAAKGILEKMREQVQNLE